MKKILFLIFLIVPGYIFGQTRAVEDLSTTETTTNSNYIVTFVETPSKAANKLYAEYFQPWLYSAGYLRPRGIATNVMIGTTSRLPYKLAVNGTFGLYDDMTLTSGKKYSFSGGQYITTNGANNDISFYSPAVGSIVNLATIAQMNDTIESLYTDSISWYYNTYGGIKKYARMKLEDLSLSLYSDYRYGATGTGYYLQLGMDEFPGMMSHNGFMVMHPDYIRMNTGVTTNQWFFAEDSIYRGPYGSGTFRRLAFYDEIGSGGSGSFDGDTLEANYVIVADSIYPMGVGVDLSDVWWGGTSNGAMDTGHVENAWYGLVHALDNPMAYLNDTKEVEGHLELKVWYIDDKTGEPACQYGIKGLSPTEAATAFQINHEFMTRYVAEHEARLQKLEQVKKQGANLGLDVKFLIGLLVFVALMGLIVGFRR
jgi:hypothetical protein